MAVKFGPVKAESKLGLINSLCYLPKKAFDQAIVAFQMKFE